MPDWTDDERKRFAGILGRSADRARTARREQESGRAAFAFVKPVFDDVMARDERDLPTGAKELVTGVTAAAFLRATGGSDGR